MKVLKYAIAAAMALAAVANAAEEEAATEQAVPLTTQGEKPTTAEAEKAAEEAVQKVGCPAAGGTFNELNAVGTVLAGQGSFLAAEACFLDAVQTVIPTFQALTELSDIRGDYLQSSARSGIVEMLAGTAQARLFHAQHLIMAGRHPEAVPRLRVLAENNKDVANVHHLYANALYNSGLRQEGIDSLKKAIELAPENKVYGTDFETLTKDFEEAKKAEAEAAANAEEKK